jgi:hypothetical protein
MKTVEEEQDERRAELKETQEVVHRLAVEAATSRGMHRALTEMLGPDFRQVLFDVASRMAGHRRTLGEAVPHPEQPWP